LVQDPIEVKVENQLPHPFWSLRLLVRVHVEGGDAARESEAQCNVRITFCCAAARLLTSGGALFDVDRKRDRHGDVEMQAAQQISITKPPLSAHCPVATRLEFGTRRTQRPPMKELKGIRGGRPGITLEDVRAATERLKEQGRLIGPVNVRLELGRGSYSTIQRHLSSLGYVNAMSAGHKKT
jgi:hypothetical protein